jgi:RNA polymerase sigma factor (sigma-70 family)
MTHSNLRLVITIARDYVDFGLPLLDLISEGNIGLMEAVGRFDPGKGSKLSAYASWWIKWAIKRVRQALGLSNLKFSPRMTDDLYAYEPLTMGIRCMNLSCFRKDKA